MVVKSRLKLKNLKLQFCIVTTCSVIDKEIRAHHRREVTEERLAFRYIKSHGTTPYPFHEGLGQLAIVWRLSLCILLSSLA